MNAESGKSLCSALAEPNVANTRRLRSVDNVLDCIRNIMPCEIVDTVIPELGRIGTMVDRFLRVLVATVIPQPYIKAYKHKVDKRIERIELTAAHSPCSTSAKGRDRSASVRHTHTSLFMRSP